MFKPLLGAALLATLALSVNAQQRHTWCATDEQAAMLQSTFHDPALARERAAAEALATRLQQDDALAGHLAQQRVNTLRVVPVVIHVVTRCGQPNVTKQQIQAGLDVLNDDWNARTPGTRPLFLPYKSNFEVEFRLAKLDPQGNPTEGIDRVTSDATDGVDPRDQIKAAAPYWANYFNIWLVNSISGGTGGGTILGYGQFPGTGPWSTWGFVMRTDEWTNPIGSGISRTAAHEIGHCFNLYHTFQGGCGTTCANSGDQVCDTPPTANDTYGCNFSQNLCSNDVGGSSPYTSNVVDQIENYMSYDACQNMFTVGQKTRIESAINSFSYMQNMMSAANLLATGVADGQTVAAPAPIPYFSSCFARVCQGQSLSFSDYSYGGNPVVSRNWTFTGATTTTDTAGTVTVTFNTPGTQTVSLVVSDGVNPPRAAYTQQVEVYAAAQLPVPMAESFEDAAFPNTTVPYIITSSSTSPNVRKWERWAFTGSYVASEGQAALLVRNPNVPAGIVSTLETPSIDTRNLATSSPTPQLQFDVAYAQRNSASADKLEVLASTDCGRTWARLGNYNKSGATLATVSQFIPNFQPAAATQWRTESLTVTSRFLNQAALRLKFDATSQGGNWLYIDNIRFNGRVLGVKADLASTGAQLVPNPLTDETSLNLTLDRPTQVAVRVTDVLGRTVLTELPYTLNAGEHTVPLGARLHGCTPGVYQVTLLLDGQPHTDKLLVR